MKIFDSHIHARLTTPKPEEIIERMEKAGVYGGCIFSNKPYNPMDAEYRTVHTFEKRMNEVLSWTKGYEDRLFPVIWIHPDEENIIENLHVAKQNGICAFKMICNDYYVYEEKAMRVLREIAKLDMPVFFHSGILWGDGAASSAYNKPLNWEPLLTIEGLRFSMGHCSWPWIDECIAMYGGFLNALINRNTAEMFFDITPGTPKIYREELLTKLYTIGYDVGNNIFFGTDANASGYNTDWTVDWLETDGKILDKLGVSKENRQKLYHDNLLRFLGKTETKIEHISPECDDSHSWKCTNPETEEIVNKWYNTLGFSKKYDDDFKEAVNEIKISDTLCIDSYDLNEKDGKRNLLSYLFMCEKLSENYKKQGISEEILIDTLKDIPRWLDTWSGLKGEMYLGELSWLKRHLSMKLFKLGRLQFCMAECEHDVPKYGLKKGDNVMEVHIPEEGPLDIDACKASIEAAKIFFEKYFPVFKYTYFTCHSWLLDETLKDIMNDSSNILKFQQLFDIPVKDKSDAIFGYIFRWKADRHDIKSCVCNSGFAERIKKRALNGGDFYEGLGVIKK